MDQEENDYYVLEQEEEDDDAASVSTENEINSSANVTSPMQVSTSMTFTPPTETTAESEIAHTSDPELIVHDTDSLSDKERSTEIAIKRTSSGKSPSKIPRYIGNSKDQHGQVSYYMSLKKGSAAVTETGSKAKFFLQIQDTHNPYMHLVPGFISPQQPFMSEVHRSVSQSTVDSERDSIFEPFFQSPEVETNNLTAHPGDLVTFSFNGPSLTAVETKGEEDLLPNSLNSVDPSVSPSSGYQTLESVADSTVKPENLQEESPSVPMSPALSVSSIPSKFNEQEQAARPVVPAAPKCLETQQEDFKLVTDNFMSYLPSDDLHTTCATDTQGQNTANALQYRSVDSVTDAELLRSQSSVWKGSKLPHNRLPMLMPLKMFYSCGFCMINQSEKNPCAKNLLVMH